MKKIAIGLCISNFDQGGAETQIWNLIRGLDRQRFEVHVIQFEHHDQRVKIHSLQDTQFKTLFAHFTFSPITAWELWRYVRRQRLELLMSMQFMDNQFSRVAGLLCRIPVITGVRGELPPVLGPYKTFVENRMRLFSDRIVTNSHWLKHLLVDAGWDAEKTLVIHNGICMERLTCDLSKNEIRREIGIPEDANVIGITARLHPMKDHQTYVRALGKLVRNNPMIVGLIVGGGVEEDNIRRWVSEMGISEHVVYSGEIVTGIGQWYRAMDVMMLTSRYGESFPNVIPEAMTCCIPVVSTDVAGVREIITDGENGFVVPIGDAKGLAERANLLLTDIVLRDNFAAAGLETARSLDTQAMVENFSRLFESVVRK